MRLCTFDFTANKSLLVNHMDCIVKHEEGDVAIISYMLQATRAVATTISIISDDIICVLSVYWAWKANVQSAAQMGE